MKRNPLLITLTLGIAAVLIGTAAQAQTENFTGPALSLGVGANRNHVEYGAFLSGLSSSKTDTSLRLDGSYGIPLSSQWVLTLGANMNLNKNDYGAVGYRNGGVPATVKARLKDQVSFYVAPGFRIAPQWLAYGKLSWQQARSEFSDSSVGAGRRTHTGTGWGLGVSRAIGRQWEARAEIQRIDFDKKAAVLSTGQPDSTEAFLYLDYRF